MFREMRRFKQQIDKSECIEILKNEPRGVLSVLGDNGYPYAFPMNFIYDEKKDKIFFHCAMEGHKTDAIKKCNRVSFCVYDKGYKKDSHWSLNIRSVIVFGRINILEDRAETAEKVRLLAEKYYPDSESVEKEMQAHISRALCLELTVDHMTGKLVNES